MIRLTYVLRRKPSLSFAEFQSYWLDKHGPKVQSAAAELGICRYIQVHTIAEPTMPVTDPLRGEMQQPFDGVAEFWFDSLESLLAFNEQRQKLDAMLFADEQGFIDHSSSAGWLGVEAPQINPSPETIVAGVNSSVVKLYYVLNHLPDADVNGVQWYWRVQHGPLVRGVGADIQALRYIQVHRLEHEFNQAFAVGRGTKNDYFGHAELWFDLSNKATEKQKPASILLYEDEAKFIDFSRSAMWYGKEYVLVDEIS
tara:strand:+ start:4269 stop:5033 length:765 start_codon:yes stop_codon:yes gene_type:complete